MEISLIQEFVILAEVGNYMTAADSLYISQPTLSRHIKKIEDDLGFPLFNRNSRKVELNQAGKLFLPYAKQILSIEQEYTNMYQNLKTEDQYTLNIGTVPMMAPYGITNIFQKFRRTYPDISLIITEMKHHEMILALEENRCDFVFMREISRAEDEFVRIPIKMDCLVAVLPKKHPLANEEKIHLEQLKNEKMLLPVKDSELYKLCVQSCREAGFEPKVSFTSRGTETAIDLVSKQMGVALLMKLPCQFVDAQNRVALVEIEPQIRASVSAAYRPNDKPGTAAKKFLGILQKLTK